MDPAAGAMAFNGEELMRAITQAISQAIASTVEAMEARRTTTPAGGVTQKNNLHKFYTRLEKFAGDDSKWKEWWYQFVVAMNAYDEKTAAIMEVVEKMELTEVSTEDIWLELTQEQAAWAEGTKSGLFNVLCLMTSGEANSLIRSCMDKNGYTAWKKVYDRFNPRTPASLTAAWREVLKPKKVKDMREAGKSIDMWENKLAVLKKEFGEEPTVGLKAALLLEMLPEAVQLTVAQGLGSKKLDYDDIKGKIKMMANVQIDYATPKPMDIGETTEVYGADWETGEWDFGVDAVGTNYCHRCGGVGHFARECPTAKGKGKDRNDQTKGKGKGKGPMPWHWVENQTGKGKGKSKGSSEDGQSKGKGKGPQYGTCWTCGGAHFQRDCPVALKGHQKGGGGVRAVEHEDENEDDDEDACVGIIGRVAEVKRENRWSKARGKRDPRVDSIVTTRNRFEALEDEEEDELWIQENTCATDKAEAEVWKVTGTAEVVIDSAADESVCPWDWMKSVHVREVPAGRRMKFRNASGGKMYHYGEKRVDFVTGDHHDVKRMHFQVTDVKRPLAAVHRIAERGHVVQFGPKAEDNFIKNVETGQRIAIRKKGRSYVMDVDVVKKTRADGDSRFTGQA